MADTQNGAQEAQSINQPKSSSNSMGTAGFVLALVAIALVWVPFLNWILGILGLVFSSIGLCKKPRNLAIAGLVVSLVFFILSFVMYYAYFTTTTKVVETSFP
jgi:flagellar biosynthesis protein FliP